MVNDNLIAEFIEATGSDSFAIDPEEYTKWLEEELLKTRVNIKPTSEDSRWIRYDDNAPKFKHAFRDNFWVKYQDGTIIRHRDKGPAGSLTHFIPKE